MLAFVVVPTAWNGYQSACWDGVQAERYTQASAKRVEWTPVRAAILVMATCMLIYGLYHIAIYPIQYSGAANDWIPQMMMRDTQDGPTSETAAGCGRPSIATPPITACLPASQRDLLRTDSISGVTIFGHRLDGRGGDEVLLRGRTRSTV